LEVIKHAAAHDAFIDNASQPHNWKFPKGFVGVSHSRLIG
jgi:hypothetical protein